MKQFDFHKLQSGELTNSFVTMGVFDGVHYGHQRLLQETREWAQQKDGVSTVITFREHPLKTLTGKAPPTIIPPEKKIELFSHWGMESCIQIDFDKEIAAISPEKFVKEYLLKRVGMKGIVIGENFRFGHRGKGDPKLLEELGKSHNFQVRTQPLLQCEGYTISSSEIRQAILQGKMKLARKMLGRPFSLIGRVIKGEQRGRALGFPTANLALYHEVHPPDGVYRGLTLWNQQIFPALISIGNCITFGENLATSIEVNLINFTGDLYEQTLETFVFEKIRPQQKFSDAQALSQKMSEDKENLLNHLTEDQFPLSSYEEKIFPTRKAID